MRTDIVRARSERRRLSGFGTAATALFAAAILLFLAGCSKKETAAPPAPPEVNVIAVVQKDVPVYQEWVAQLSGPVNADITPKVQGYLLRQAYQNGYFVKKGQLLFELDPRQYQAQVEQAKAQLAYAEANLARFDADVQRDIPLAAQNAIPQKQLDTDIANQAAARAEVQSKKANLANAELNLAWTKIYSPIDAIAGVSNSQIGELVGPTTKMATVSRVNPIWAYFSVSESLFLGIAPKVTQIITGKASQASLRNTPVEFIQANNVSYPKKGTIIYVNRQVGTQTGTIQMAAEFPNPDAVLRPGGFGRVRIQTSENKNALLVPQVAVIEVQSQYQVIVLTADNKAVFRPVKVGDRVAQDWIISEGLKPGERVVVEGIQKVQLAAAQASPTAKEGIPVIAKPYTAGAGGSI
jgi:membrane fusion protein (multidrug efflux system)